MAEILAEDGADPNAAPSVPAATEPQSVAQDASADDSASDSESDDSAAVDAEPSEPLSQAGDAPEEDSAEANERDKLTVSGHVYEEGMDISVFLKQVVAEEDGPPVLQVGDDSSELQPFSSDLDYIEAQVAHLFCSLQIAELRRDEESSQAYRRYGSSQTQENEQRMRQLQAKERVAKGKAQLRLELTRKAGKWLPRIERMVEARGLDEFEKNVLMVLIASHISPTFQAIGRTNGMDVGTLLRIFCKNFKEQVKYRKYFYKSGTLVKEGMLRLSTGSFETDLNSCYCDVDRRMLDFALGLDTEFSELVEGSHLYMSKVELCNVVLAEEQKKLIMDSVESFEDYKKARKKYGFDDTVSYGSGIVMLFYGASGTGKTMMANAIGHHMKKRILLINFPSLGTFSGAENLKWIFREAKINDAILFFDECESIFESRDHGNVAVNLLLTEFERHDGLVILATNRAYDLDEAMHRRITIAVEFQKPDPILREKIWRSNIPEQLVLADDVNLKALAMSYELTGGFIKNALLSALSIAVSRDGERNIVVRQEDLEAGAKLQLRGRLRMVDFHRRVLPKRGIDDLVLPQEKKKILQEIVMFEKAHQVLFSQWGFDRTMGHNRGTTVLLYGPPGTGKTMSCEAIAFGMGKPLKVVNAAELLSKWVGDTPKNIDAVFEDGRQYDAVLVFDEAEGLFGKRTASSESASERYANVDVGLLLYHMEHYPGVVVLSTNQPKAIDPAFFRRIKFVMEIPLPGPAERAKLWRGLIPAEAPISSNVDFVSLGRMFEFSGGHIQSCVIRAAARAALAEEESARMITMELLLAAGQEEVNKAKQTVPGL